MTNRSVIELCHTILKPLKQIYLHQKPHWSGAVTHNGTLYTAQIPIDETGQVVEGGIEAQTRQTFENLISTLKSAGEDLSSVLQVLIYVTDREHLATVNKVYAEYFDAPYPNRAAMVIAGLAREEMLVEFVVYSAVKQ